MKRKITDPVLDYENKPFCTGQTVVTASLIDAIEKRPKDEVLADLKKSLTDPMTWRDVFNTALNSQAKDEHLTSQDKSQCYQITKKCFATNEPDFTTKEAAFIIDRVEKIYIMPLIIGRVQELFDTK